MKIEQKENRIAEDCFNGKLAKTIFGASRNKTFLGQIFVGVKL